MNFSDATDLFAGGGPSESRLLVQDTLWDIGPGRILQTQCRHDDAIDAEPGALTSDSMPPRHTASPFPSLM